MSRRSSAVNPFIVPLALFVPLVLVLLYGLKHAPEKSIIPSPLIGKPAPVFAIHDLMDDHRQVSNRQFEGHWTLVNVWGTWCAECRVEQPALLSIQQQGDVQMLGIDWKDDDQAAQAWLAKLGNPYAAVGTDHDGRVAIDWGVYGAPESFLVDPNGRVVHKLVGAMSDEIWRRDFLPLIKTSSVRS